MPGAALLPRSERSRDRRCHGDQSWFDQDARGARYRRVDQGAQPVSTSSVEQRIKKAIDIFGADVSASNDAWAAIQRRARTGRVSWPRRVGLALGALSVLIGVGVPIEQMLTPADHDETRVTTIKPEPRPGATINPAPP